MTPITPISEPPPLVFVVDDDVALAESYADTLSAYTFRTEVITRWNGLQDALMDVRPQAILLDQHLHGVDTVARLDELRASTDAAILMVAANRDVSDRVLALERGADDFLVKPVSGRELVARTRAALRRQVQTIGGGSRCRINDQPPHLLHPDGRQVLLQPPEAVLLEALLGSPGRPVTSDVIADLLDAQAIRSTPGKAVARLQRKLQAAGMPWAVNGVARHGYVLVRVQE